MWTHPPSPRSLTTRQWRRRSLTLIELIVASALTLLAAAGIYQSMLMIKGVSQLDAQHVAAMSLCQDQLEALRMQSSAHYDRVLLTPNGNPTREENLVLTHTEARVTHNIRCQRLTEITDFELSGGEIKIRGGRRRGWENLAPGIPNVNWNQHGKGGQNNSIYRQKGAEAVGRVHTLAKYVVIAVTWEHRGRPQVEMLEGIMYNYDL